MEDRVALVPMARYTESVVANAQVSLYEGVGHMPFWEEARRFNRELGEFVIKSNER
jgi:pimeloyl-ACP methyl ester carboxylesterase